MPNLHDPDFDQSQASKGTATFFEQLSPKSAMLVGLVGGVMALCTIGFVVLLTMVLRGGVSLSKSADTGSLAGAPSAPPAQPGAPDAPTGAVPPVASGEHIRGNQNAAVTLIEYSDFECPFCKRFHPTVLQALKEYGDKIRLVYRHFPLSFHANAQKEAEASECAAELGGNTAFWNFADKIYERTTSNGTGFALTALAPLAKEIGLDPVKFQTCLDSGKYATLVQDSESKGQAAGIQGTPGTFVVGKNGQIKLVSGAVPYAQLKAAIDAASK